MKIVNKRQQDKRAKYILAKSEIDDFIFSLFFPLIPEKIKEESKPKDLVLLMKRIDHVANKRYVNGRSILDNKLAYHNLSISQNKNIKKGKKAA